MNWVLLFVVVAAVLVATLYFGIPMWIEDVMTGGR
jgi:hypothetical protein